MLEGKLDGRGWVAPPSPLMKAMLACLAEPSVRDLPAGRYETGGDTFFVINAYETQPASALRAESHRRFCDVQVMLEGEEMMGWTKRRPDLPSGAYDDQNDVMFYEVGLGLEWRRFSPGDVFVFAPDDVHLPGVLLDRPTRIRKAVGKLPWASLEAEWPTPAHL